MSINDNEIKRFLNIQSHERFAKLFIDNCTSNIKVFDKGEVYIYNNEFNYYQLATSTRSKFRKADQNCLISGFFAQL